MAQPDRGRPSARARLASLLPRVFFQHFGPTSIVVYDGDRLVAFLIGFLSRSHDDEAYVHLVGVDPGARGRGLGRSLYEWFFDAVRAAGRTTIHAVTGPENTGSQQFHRRMGFAVGVTVPDDDGSGNDRVALTRVLEPDPS